MNLQNIRETLKDEKSYRLKQAEKAVFKDHVESWDMVNTLPALLRKKLTENCPVSFDYESIVSHSKDTLKALIKLDDGLAVETVLLQHARGRNTVCVSSQVGCPLGCLFCRTGEIGYKRNLTVYEIAEQVLFFSYYLKKKNAHVTNVVFMGMGEPFLNYGNVMEAIRIINDKDKFNIGARKISISTCGIPRKIERLSKENLQVNLAISLSAPDNSLRSKLMPINNKYPVEAVISAAKEYISNTNRRVMFEYVLIDKLNDSPGAAKELAKILKGLLCFVNLIPFNGRGEPGAPSKEKVSLFKSILKKSGISVTERFRFGQDINAACGQLLYSRD